MEGHTITREQLEQRFQFHPGDTETGKEHHAKAHAILLEAADKLVELTGAPSREQSTMVTKLEEATMWADVALTRGDGPRA